jgi:hypothetical protein
VLGRLTANQRSWMEAVAGAIGGTVFGDAVWQPNPHGELLVPFPERAPGGLGSALSRAASAKAATLGIDTIGLNAESMPLYESLGFSSLGHGRTWWRHLSCG